MNDTFLGKLNLDAIPYHDPIIMSATAMIFIVSIALVGGIAYFKKWGYLWNEWLTSVDHKRVGVMYIILAFIMLLRGFSDAIMMRAQQAIASNGSEGYLPPHHYDQVFTAHGVIMIFFVAMPLITGLMNLVVPLQIGARDVAFPFLNSLSFWLAVSGAILVNVSLFIGEFAATGWLAFPPLSTKEFSPSVGVDYYIWALQISGIGTTLTGVNFIVTILKMRAKGMTLMRMPVFTWTALIANFLIAAAFPVLTVTLALLTMDRYFDTHFFTNAGGGDAMLYVNLIWIWGHPEVYILVLPAFGVYSEVVATFSGKRLFGYKSMVYATGVIGLLSFIVWLHHFFTMGAGAKVNAFFGIATMIISIPTGVKIFNWLFTMYKGRIRFELPMLWTIAAIITFAIGGMTGVLLAVPAADFVLHNSVFLIAHFHNAIIGGAVFGYFAGIAYWFPKAFGFKLDRKTGLVSFWCWFIGFFLAFMPVYALGLMGMTRRINHYDNPAWQPLLIVSAVGVAVIGIGVAFQVLQIIVSIKNRKALRDHTGDPWNGRTLEWATSSPPPLYNFASEPVVHDIDAFADDKKAGRAFKQPTTYTPIHMPRNTWAGIVISAIATVMGFALVWHIWWLAIVSFLGVIVSWIVHSFNDDIDYYVPVEQIKRLEDAHFARLTKAQANATV